MNIINNKKGVSPVISTILLIAFAAALGMVVMSWGKSYEGYSIITDVRCEDTSLKVVTIRNDPLICHDNKSQIFITLQNNGEMDISGIKITMLGKDGITSRNIDKFIKVADIFVMKTDYSSIGQLQKVIIVPEIDENKLCVINDIELDEIKLCKNEN